MTDCRLATPPPATHSDRPLHHSLSAEPSTHTLLHGLFPDKVTRGRK